MHFVCTNIATYGQGTLRYISEGLIRAAWTERFASHGPCRPARSCSRCLGGNLRNYGKHVAVTLGKVGRVRNRTMNKVLA